MLLHFFLSTGQTAEGFAYVLEKPFLLYFSKAWHLLPFLFSHNLQSTAHIYWNWSVGHHTPHDTFCHPPHRQTEEDHFANYDRYCFAKTWCLFFSKVECIIVNRNKLYAWNALFYWELKKAGRGGKLGRQHVAACRQYLCKWKCFWKPGHEWTGNFL